MNGYININQKGLVDFCKENNCKIDLVDATILSYIANFLLSDKIIKKIIDNRVYGWISTKKIIQDNPLINISNTEVVGRRIKKLIDIGLLYAYLCKKEGNRKYYAISENLHRIITNSYTPTYSVVINSVLNDYKLSLKAKGVYFYIANKPKGWHFSLEIIASQSKDGIKSVRAGIKELIEAGYLERIPKKEKNKFTGWEYILKTSTKEQ